jgi:hypothetical protein
MGRIDTRYYGGKLCPVCGTDSKGCSATDDGFQFCRAPDSDISPDTWVKLKDAGGYGCYRHKSELDANSRRGFYAKPRRPKVKPAPGSASTSAKAKHRDSDSPPPDWPSLTRSFTAELTPSRRTELARSLGVPTDATYLITDLGYIHKSPCVLDGKPIDPGHWTFPETDATGTPIGVLRRWRKGMNPYGEEKQQMKGGHRGLSIPRGWREHDGPFVCFEGPTDTLTAAHAGLAAVGRASNNSGAELLAELLALTEWPADRPVIIAGENDARPSKKNPDKIEHPGRDGALAVARKLAEILRRPVQVAFPPADAKDVRDWLTSPDRGDTPWRERGRQLLDHLTATAETINPPSIETPPGDHSQDNACPHQTGRAAEEAAGAAADEVLELLTPTCWCRRVRPQIVERISNGKLGVVPFGCHKTSCPTCGMFKKRELFESTETYLPRVTSEDESVGGMSLYCAVVDVGDEHAAQRHIRDYNGEYLAVLTDESADCMDRIAPQPPAVILRHVDAPPDTCLKMTGVAIAAVLPRNAPPPPGFLPVPVATAFRFIGTALRHTPAPAEGTKRYRPWRASHGWGDPLIKEPGDIKVKCPVKFSHEETAEILAELKLLVPFWFGDPTVQGKPLGIGGTPAQSLSVSLLLGGVGRTAADMPERDDIVTRAAEWVKYLAKPDLANVGGGSNVYGVIREYLWSGPVGRCDQIRDQLLKANATDEEENRIGEEYREDITAFVQHALAERWVGELLLRGHRRVAAGESVRKVRREVFAEAQRRWAKDTSFLMDLFRDRVESVFMGRVRKAVARGKAEASKKADGVAGEATTTDKATAA